MLLLITGGSASGKSEYAEKLLCEAAADNRVYLATMRPLDAESAARVAKHRLARAGRGFATIERCTALGALSLPPCGGILLECLSNLAANELFDPDGAGENAASAILRGVDRLCAAAPTVAIVTNEIFSDGVSYDAETMRYIALLGGLNRALAGRADRVIEVVCGIPIFHKGGV